MVAVAAAIELDDGGLASHRPVSSFVNVYPIYRTAFVVTVYGLQVTQNQSIVESEITASVESYFASREPYVHGLTLDARRDRITSSAAAGAVQDAIDAHNGVVSGVITTESGDAVIVRALGKGEKASVTVLFP